MFICSLTRGTKAEDLHMLPSTWIITSIDPVLSPKEGSTQGDDMKCLERTSQSDERQKRASKVLDTSGAKGNASRARSVFLHGELLSMIPQETNLAFA